MKSLHELTCEWGVSQHGLSLDSTRLPKYVRPTGDSLRVAGSVLAYSVKMIEPRESIHAKNTLYFVAEVADSLFYTKIQDEYPKGSGSRTVHVRSLRPLTVPGAKAQYLWFEYAEVWGSREDTSVVAENWTGHILTFDSTRGMRHLHKAPIRKEVKKDGKLIREAQWEVKVPEPGIMTISPLIDGELKDNGRPFTVAPQEWLGRHVIDPTATSKREVEAEAGYKTIIDTTEVENWREKYERY